MWNLSIFDGLMLLILEGGSRDIKRRLSDLEWKESQRWQRDKRERNNRMKERWEKELREKIRHKEKIRLEEREKIQRGQS